MKIASQKNTSSLLASRAVKLIAMVIAIFSVHAGVAEAQIGNIEGAWSASFAPRYGIQTHVRIKGWANDSSGARSCNFVKQWMWVVIQMPNHADVSRWVQADEAFGYRPDVRTAGKACTEWSGFDTTIVFPNVYTYPGTRVSLGMFRNSGGFEWFSNSGITTQHLNIN